MSKPPRRPSLLVKPQRDTDGTFGSPDPDAEKPARRGGFQPGKSGNPGGKPKAVKMLMQRVGELTKDGQDILEFMNKVMRGEEPNMGDERVRFAAAVWLGDRFFGKPKQTVELTPGPADPGQSNAPPLRDLLLALDEKDRGDLERILTSFERARTEGRLALPGAVLDVDDGEETPN